MHAPGRTSCSSSGLSRRPPARGALLACMALAALFGGLGPAQAELAGDRLAVEEREEAGYIEAYLSDQRRVGSLAGSILGGALIAHPAGTVVGSVLGFVLGSQAMKEDDVRSGSERDGTVANVLALANQDAFGSRPGPGAIGHEASAASATPITPPATVSTYPLGPGAAHPAAPHSREQIMQICALGPPADPRLRAMCYYFQGR